MEKFANIKLSTIFGYGLILGVIIGAVVLKNILN